MQRRPFQSSPLVPRRSPLVLLLAAQAAIACRPAEPEQRYGFIARLGATRYLWERNSPAGIEVVVDGVDRFPRVRRRHTAIELGPGSTIRHLVMDIHTPSEPANQRERHVTADVTADSVHILQTDDAGKLRHEFATNGAVAMAHVPQMYSLYELFFDGSLARTETSDACDTVQLRQFYIDRDSIGFRCTRWRLYPTPGGAQHDWLRDRPGLVRSPVVCSPIRVREPRIWWLPASIRSRHRHCRQV
jgi:hypothetical protein